MVNSSPVSYQYVSFVRGGRNSDSPGRRSRSFGFASKQVFSQSHFWNDGDFQPHENSLSFEEHNGHFTPDFSDGLGTLNTFIVTTINYNYFVEYPDPYLLTGDTAKRVASYLYRKPLFFGEINHIDAIFKNQEQRRRSGLAGNRLGSLRPNFSPWFRSK